MIRMLTKESPLTPALFPTGGGRIGAKPPLPVGEGIEVRGA